MKAFYLLTKLLPHRLILDVMERIEYAPKAAGGNPKSGYKEKKTMQELEGHGK